MYKGSFTLWPSLCVFVYCVPPKEHPSQRYSSVARHLPTKHKVTCLIPGTKKQANKQNIPELL